jgi:hypothetical protein
MFLFQGSVKWYLFNLTEISETATHVTTLQQMQNVGMPDELKRKILSELCFLQPY